MAHPTHQDPKRSCSLLLNGSQVTVGFRKALFEAALRTDLTLNEFVLARAAERLAADGYEFPGVFEAGDLTDLIGGGR